MPKIKYCNTFYCLQAKAKELRNNRVGSLKTQHRYLMEMAAAMLGRTPEYVLVSKFWYN